MATISISSRTTALANYALRKTSVFVRSNLSGVANTIKDYDYVLFLDSDIGVVNPKRLIEDFIDPHADITFYDRFYNWEIMAGSYLVKSSNWSIAFLQVANTIKDYDYVLFLDSDIGVVNPKRLIEDFIDPHADITFYDRFYNWEIMAGSYLVKSSNWSIAFLQGFAAYESRVPKKTIGSDNGALHRSRKVDFEENT
ncbi:unnamed protein product [Strongylus vulgaris]|uniref:Nucleotide-diphospho-sugar transferase domain-containing protein n=1 Tax=Strongylus vulgaris TaxID=40348 RepID=A0A3P7JV94_STRVU|nr:unnamed protein product [Strongylus vulgaris]